MPTAKTNGSMHMRRSGPLTENEQMILLAVVRLEEGAYGVAVCEEIERRTGRSISVAATYTALERMEERRLVRSRVEGPTPVRGGRARKKFALAPAGAAALRESRRAMSLMWEGLEEHPELAGS